jgi:hypothetical protein
MLFFFFLETPSKWVTFVEKKSFFYNEMRSVRDVKNITTTITVEGYNYMDRSFLCLL